MPEKEETYEQKKEKIKNMSVGEVIEIRKDLANQYIEMQKVAGNFNVFINNHAEYLAKNGINPAVINKMQVYGMSVYNKICSVLIFALDIDGHSQDLKLDKGEQ